MPVQDVKKQRKEIETSKKKLEPIETNQLDIQNTYILNEKIELNISVYIDLIESCIRYLSLPETDFGEKKDEIQDFKLTFSDRLSKLPQFSRSLIQFGQTEIQVQYFLSAFLEILYNDLEKHNKEVAKFYLEFYTDSIEEKNRSFWKDFLNSFEDNRADEQRLRNFKFDLILTNFSKKDKDMINKYNDLIFSNNFLVMSLDDDIFKCEGINIKVILTKIVSNEFVLNCFDKVINSDNNIKHNEAYIKENLIKIIEDFGKICFTKYGSFSILGITIFSGDIILKREWLKEISCIIGRMRFTEDIKKKLTIDERINKMNFSFGDETHLKKQYFVYISFIVLTIIHEMVHIYRRRFINKLSFENTPKFILGGKEFDDGGEGVDFLMFGEILEKLYPMQAELLLSMDWTLSLSEKDAFQTKFKNLCKKDKSPPVRFKCIGGIPYGKCYRAYSRSTHNN